MATDGDGAFSNKPITVPASAVPGDHFVTAIGRTTGLAAQKTFTVRTDWPAFRNSPKHKGFNPLENVLDSSNVSGLDEAWESAATGNSIFSSPAVANGVVFVGSRDNKVYAFPASCSTPCSPLWSSAATGGGIFSSPAVANGVVYVGSQDNKVYAFPASCSTPCSPVWSSAATGNGFFSSPAVANGVVFVGSQDAKVYAFPASCSTPCSPLWSAATGSAISSSPAVANGVVFVGSDDAKLYTYDLAAGPTAPARPDPADLHPDLSLRASG